MTPVTAMTYRVERGPLSPPASLYGRVRELATGDTFTSASTPWIRQCVRDGRLALVAATAAAETTETTAAREPTRSRKRSTTS